MSTPNNLGCSQTSRREFLQKSGILAVAAIAAEQATIASASAADMELPQIKFGRYSLSRLICGTNPFNGGSHLSVFVNHAMKEYYTEKQILKTLNRCQEVGINCWQAGYGNLRLYQRLVEKGGKMHYLAIGNDPTQIKEFVAAGTIGLAHHGERTDRAFKEGRLDEINDYLKRVRDAGLMVGVSTHMPAVIEEVESRGWDVDYYMACVYERHRSAAELEKLLGQAPIPVGEVYLPNDPPRMFTVMRQTPKPCLAFKILAAGRLSKKKAWVEKAFRETFTSIKPNDAVIVGIYDRYSDQPAENAAYTRRFCST
ncbi:MAG: hypothetical protein AMJ65_03865 [Phycisphaerae bacterium SG8_4]|nr:MAG: hypothetical protein AMJ65_03865 [Phycisphaerae bacterium SG8_4]